jgi:hypothetical protein
MLNTSASSNFSRVDGAPKASLAVMTVIAMAGTLRPIAHGSTADRDRLGLNAERRTGADIHTFGEAIWWSTPITTVGPAPAGAGGSPIRKPGDGFQLAGSGIGRLPGRPDHVYARIVTNGAYGAPGALSHSHD